MLRSTGWLLLALLPASLFGQSPTLSPELQKYVRVQSPRVVLTHVRVIDGTGGPAVEDRNVVIEDGKISAIQAGADVTSTKETNVLDLRGSTVMDFRLSWHQFGDNAAETQCIFTESGTHPVISGCRGIAFIENQVKDREN